MKKIGIGYENYIRLIEDGCYFVDKTLLIRELIEMGGMVTLFARPRRFGKTLALSMLQAFFEDARDNEGSRIDNSCFFYGMKIMDCDDGILSRMGKFPVIRLSLKSAKQPDFKTAFLKLREEIVSEFSRHDYLKTSEALNDEDRNELLPLFRITPWESVASKDALNDEIGRYSTSLRILSKCLSKHHGHNVIILLDEYDVPLENAYYAGFYDEMAGFIRSLFESCLKTNDSLEFAVITGCLRISRESIFTGLNHLKIDSVLDDAFAESFGFTSDETKEMLDAYGISDRVDEVKKWYDGYLFGEKEIYNPWSVISYVDDKVNSKRKYPRPYWANTSANSIIRDLVENADEGQRQELELLIEGGTIEKRVHEDITYDEIYSSPENLWNFLFFTGYMKKVSERREDNDILITMRIPNTEVECIYKDHIRSWFEERIKEADRSILYRAVKEQDTETISDFVTVLLEKSISTFDSDEAFYHGFFLSLLTGLPSYASRSNREEGNGRPDIVMYPNRPRDPAYIFEIKIRKKFNEMNDGIEEAFTQIRDQRYEDGVLCDGYSKVISYGVCFCKKACIVELYNS